MRNWPADLSVGLDHLAGALDRQIAVDDQVGAVSVDSGRGERDLGIALGVEEVGRQQMPVQVLVANLDAIRPDCPVQARLTVLVCQGDGEVGERAAEGGHDHVLDGEAHLRVDGVGLPDAGGDGCLCLGCLCLYCGHLASSSRWGKLD